MAQIFPVDFIARLAALVPKPRVNGTGAPNRCIEDQDVFDRIVAHLRKNKTEAPARPFLVPPTSAPPATPSFFA
jgi:hypothetical protein